MREKGHWFGRKVKCSVNDLDARAKAIFLEAIEQNSPEGRTLFLDSACGGNKALRARMEELIRAHELAGNFLGGQSLQSDQSEEPAAERPGASIGHYKLVEEIGEGGFGIVFLAEQQQPIRRKVALKILKPGMDSRRVIARFETERQALALMDHPNIARVLDAGQTALGRPYFVMDLVKGVPITRYCDEQQLSPRERAELFLHVCEAVQHAHQKGIIHRDLKPTNVLIASYDGRPVPKVIDFGVAKALGQQLTDLTGVTGFGGIVGTLEYMSPEQAEFNAMDVDTRADIYSLGVLLYELLTGTTPLTPERLKQAAMTESLRLIREEEPPKPSTRLSDSKDSLPSVSAQRKLEPARLTREVQGDLDWIVMKCLEKDRSRRYESASGLGQDIERYLRDEAVEASPPSRWYRLRKFARKNRRLIGTAAMLALLLAGGTGVSAWQAVRARAAERDALGARDREAEQLQQAKKAEARVRMVLKFFQDKVLAAARPKGQEGGLSRDVTLREVLDQAESEISMSFADEPLVEASIRNTLGVSYWYLGTQDRAMRQQERALALRRQELGSDHPDTVGIMNDLAIILISQGKLMEARNVLAEVVEVKRRTLGPEDPITLRSVSNLAGVTAMLGSYEEASKLTEDTWHIQQRVEGPEKIFTLRAAYNLAIMWRHLGQVADSRKLFEETLQTLNRVFGPDNQDTLRVMNCLGEFLLDQGQLAEARKFFEQTLERQKKVLGETSDETILTIANLADTSRAQGRFEEAGKLAETAADLHRRTLGPEHPQTLFANTILANVYRDRGQYAEARKLYEETLTRQRPILSPKTVETQKLMNSFAWMLATAADAKYRDPKRAADLAMEVVLHAPQSSEKWTTLGVAYYRTGDWKNAIASLEKSETLAPVGFTAANSFFEAMAYWQLGDKERARTSYERATIAMPTSSGMSQQELARFRVETVKLLGIPKPQLPANFENK
jgi:serine/threonine protein kinase/Tfp pilus assembly protein PilF